MQRSRSIDVLHIASVARCESFRRADPISLGSHIRCGGQREVYRYLTYHVLLQGVEAESSTASRQYWVGGDQSSHRTRGEIRLCQRIRCERRSRRVHERKRNQSSLGRKFSRQQHHATQRLRSYDDHDANCADGGISDQPACLDTGKAFTVSPANSERVIDDWKRWIGEVAGELGGGGFAGS